MSQSAFPLTRNPSKAYFILDMLIADNPGKAKQINALRSPIRLGQALWIERFKQSAFAAWAYMSRETFRSYIAGRPCLLDISDWNEGDLLVITHLFCSDISIALSLRSSLVSYHKNAETVAWIRRYNNGRRRLHLKGDVDSFLECL